MDSKPVFVLIMAKTCGACQNFKRRIWSTLKKELIESDKVDIVEIEVPTTASAPSTTKYHKDLRKFIGWFPTMSLFTGYSWNNPASTLKGIIKNGKMVNNRVETIGKPDFSKNSVLEWIYNNLSTNEMFKQSNDIIITHNKEQQNTKEFYTIPTYGQYIKFKESKLPRDW